MAAIVEQGMRDGAFGLSTGLFYVPGTFTPTEEVIELARAAGRLGGIHESHQRDDAAKLLDSVNETIAIGEKGGLPTQITHAKVSAWRTGDGASTCWRWSTRRGRAAWTSRSISIPTRRRAQHRGGADSRVGARRRARGDAGAAEGLRRRARRPRPASSR